MGNGEPDVEDYFKDKIFPKPRPLSSLKRTDRQPMSKHTVPSTGSKLKVSNPVPDMLYGYNRRGAFPQQQVQLISMGTETVANNQGLMYPFFVVEFKGDGGSMWVATNQCLRGSTSSINSAAFSIAMSGSEARLYISWKHNELDYYMGNVECFLLHRPDHYLEFRKKRTSELAKSHPPPSDGSATSSGKRRKSSLSRGRGSTATSVQSQSGGAGEDYWTWDQTYERWFHMNDDRTIVWAKQGGLSQGAAD
ncbi:hypothetical protein K469DRAFT_707477 [Zopfia rhizophila CBS 207.26]|uniref:DUF7924 domain-containing protein n=1 Tax=Zopfia rhizophila CBS 207.26 TaxID=1314779 RepID=A0A6A6E1L2_9PEZI|nr:hypothetical protein K469DRAFT_707477 [Zopfia rhizophila CBS 207.26]